MSDQDLIEQYKKKCIKNLGYGLYENRLCDKERHLHRESYLSCDDEEMDTMIASMCSVIDILLEKVEKLETGNKKDVTHPQKTQEKEDFILAFDQISCK